MKQEYYQLPSSLSFNADEEFSKQLKARTLNVEGAKKNNAHRKCPNHGTERYDVSAVAERLNLLCAQKPKVS